MTLSKRNSRKITVDNKDYSWAISPNSGFVVLIVEARDLKGRKMEVYIRTDINDLWANFPHAEDLDLKIIKPGDVKLIITQALNLGWNPTEKGKSIAFELIGNQIIKS